MRSLLSCKKYFKQMVREIFPDFELRSCTMLIWRAVVALQQHDKCLTLIGQNLEFAIQNIIPSKM